MSQEPQELLHRCSVCGLQFMPEQGRWHKNSFICHPCPVPEELQTKSHWVGTIAFVIEQSENGDMGMTITHSNLLYVSLGENQVVENQELKIEEYKTPMIFEGDSEWSAGDE